MINHGMSKLVASVLAILGNFPKFHLTDPKGTPSFAMPWIFLMEKDEELFEWVPSP